MASLVQGIGRQAGAGTEKGGTPRTSPRHPGTGAAGIQAAHTCSSHGKHLHHRPGSGRVGCRHKLFTYPRMKMLLTKQKQLRSRAGRVQLLQDSGLF